MTLYNSRKTNLSPSQQEAVNSVHGPVMCIAGPGSGKTLTIVHRLINMIKNHNIEPTNILVVTFSKASAVEIRKRFLHAINNDECKVNFGTFHSIFFQLLKREYNYSGENIISEGTSYKIILSLLSGKDSVLSSNPDIITRLLGEISLVKSTTNNPAEFKSSIMNKSDFCRIYNSYNNYLAELNLIDFEDIIQKTYNLLISKPQVLNYWQNKFKFILVDEFQDINPLQYEIIRLLASPENNLFVVGDDDQAIYSFRGSSPAIMQQFPKDFLENKTIQLTINYRCSEEILKTAARVIGYNKGRYPKELVASNKGGSKVVVKGFEDSHPEYTYLSKLIGKELDEGIKPEEIAVLVRTNAQCGAIAAKLVEYNIPFNLKGNIPTIYDNRYLIPIIAYIRFLAGDYSRDNFLQFYNKPIRYITRESLTDNEIDICELCDYFKGEEKDYVAENLRELAYHFSIMKNLDTAAAIRYIRRVVGYENYLKENLNLKDNIFEEIVEYMDELESDAVPYRSLTSYIEHIAEYRKKLERINDKPQSQAINLVTYHGCKGLEYDIVYMPECIEGVTPHRLSLKPEEVEEERRMFYVAMTRARKKLYLSHSAKRHGRQNKPSRFINEILISNEKPVKGMRLIHETYRAGTILSVEGDVLVIKFDNLLVPKKLSYKSCMEKGLVEILG